jgi:hypothetical protein
MNEGTAEDIRRGTRRRTKGENGRIKFKKKGIENKPRRKAFSEHSTCDRETSKYEATLQNQNTYEKIILKCYLV